MYTSNYITESDVIIALLLMFYQPCDHYYYEKYDITLIAHTLLQWLTIIMLMILVLKNSVLYVSFSLELSDPLLDDPLSLPEDDDSPSSEELDDSAVVFSTD